MAAVLGNHVQIVFGPAPTASPRALRRDQGAWRDRLETHSAIACGTDNRRERIPGYDIVSWYGVVAPAKTPHHIVMRLSKEIETSTKTRTFADALPDYELIGNTPAEFAAFLRKDAKVSARVIAQSGAKAN